MDQASTFDVLDGENTELAPSDGVSVSAAGLGIYSGRNRSLPSAVCIIMADKNIYPSNPRLAPNGEGVICDQCGRKWDPAKGESPNCIECAAAWARLEAEGNPHGL